MAQRGGLEARGNDAEGFATGGQGGIGDHAHQADLATAVDQGEAALGEGPSEVRGRFGEDRRGAGLGTTEDTDGFQRHGNS